MTTPSLPASGHGEVAGLVEELVRAVSLRCHSHPGPERRSAIKRADAAKSALLAAILTAAPTPSPVEARADGVRVKDWRAVAKLAGEHGIRYRTNRALEAFLSGLAALESTPAQPVREGQEGKAEPVAWRWRDRSYGTLWIYDPEPEWLAQQGDHIEKQPLYASQPDPAAEITRLTKERDEANLAYEQMNDAWLKVQDEIADANARAERAESELAVIREALSDAVTNLEMYRGAGIDDVVAALEAALANTAHRGQEEKGNG